MYERKQVNTLIGYEDVLSIYYIDIYGNVYGKNEMELKQRDNMHGYKYIKLKVDGERKWKQAYIHRLVALAFVKNDDILDKMEVNHKDENKANNYYKNLEWCNRLYNVRYGTGIERGAIARRMPCYVYDFKLNLCKRCDSINEASKFINHDIKSLNCRIKEYYILEDMNLQRVIKINRKAKITSIVITDITNYNKFYFYSNRAARKFFNGQVNITQAIQKNWTVKGRYKVRCLNYKKLIDSLDL